MAPLLSKRTPVSMSTIRVAASAPTPTNTTESSTKIRYVCLKPEVVLLDVRHLPSHSRRTPTLCPSSRRPHSCLGADGWSRFFVKEVPSATPKVLHLPLIKNLQQDQRPESDCGTIRGGRKPEYRGGDGVCLGSLPSLPPHSSLTPPEVPRLEQKPSPRKRVTVALDHRGPGQETNQILLQTNNRGALTGSQVDQSPAQRGFLRRTSAHSCPQINRKTSEGSPGPHGYRDRKCFLKKKADVDVSAHKVPLDPCPPVPLSGADRGTDQSLPELHLLQTKSKPGPPEPNSDQSPGPGHPRTQFVPAPPAPLVPPLLDSSFLSLDLGDLHSTRSPDCTSSSSSPFSSAIGKHNVLIFVEDLASVRPSSDGLHGEDLREEDRGERYHRGGEAENRREEETSRRWSRDWSASATTSDDRTVRNMGVQSNQDLSWIPPSVWSYLGQGQGSAEPLSSEKVEALRSVHPALAVFVLCEVIKNQLLLMRSIYRTNQNHHSREEKFCSTTPRNSTENIRRERTKVWVEDAVRQLCQEMGLDR